MTDRISNRAELAARQVQKTPSIVVEFDDVDFKFSNVTILRLIRIGDVDLEIGNDWKIGGSVPIDGQNPNLSYDADFGSTSTKIEYKLNPDRGTGSAVSSMELAIVDDRADTILGLISTNEMLGRKCKVWLSPNAAITDFPDDYMVIFRGVVDSVDAAPGGIKLALSHTDQKKRQSIFNDFSTDLTNAINNSQTTGIVLDDVSGLLTPINGPTGSPDSNVQYFVQIEDELIRYTGISGNTLTGVSRAQLGTVANSHDAGEGVKVFYRIQGSALEIALKLMLSGWNGNFKTGVEATAINQINPDLNVPNSIFFQNVDLEENYGLTIGDFVTTTGFTNGANNVTLKEITDLVDTGNGTYIVVDGVSFVNETLTSGTVSFRSKWDTFPSGLKMSPDEVDVDKHEYLNSLFLSGAVYDLYIKAGIDDAKTFIEQEIYSPVSAYSLPRRSRSSVGYHIPPLPNQFVPTLNDKNVRQASRIIKKRSIGKNFYNTIIYKFDVDSITDKMLQGKIYTDATSRDEIKIGTKALIIEAGGLRDENIASINASRRLQRYAFAADFFSQIKLLFKDGYYIEPGDIVILDGTNLNIANFDSGKRDGDTKLYEVISKTLDLRTGDIGLELTNTGFNQEQKYGLISPASYVRRGISNTQFEIESSFASEFNDNEYLKWNSFDPLPIRVRNLDYSISATGLVSQFTGNIVTLESSLGFTASAGMLMEFSDYPVSEPINLVYVAISQDASGFANGDLPFSMI